MRSKEYPAFDEEEVRLLIEYRDDRSQEASWKKFNELSERLDIELAQQTTPAERLLSIGWFYNRPPKEKKE